MEEVGSWTGCVFVACLPAVIEVEEDKYCYEVEEDGVLE